METTSINRNLNTLVVTKSTSLPSLAFPLTLESLELNKIVKMRLVSFIN